MDEERTEETAEPKAPVTKKTPVTKVTPVVTEAEAAGAAAPADEEAPVSEAEEFDVSLGPLFTLGAVLVLLGVLRRRPLAVVAGLGAIWLDQRSELGRRLKEQVVSRARG